MAHKKNKRAKGDEVKLEMTPMIDVVFQLLIFFIVTFKQEDILASVQAMRPEAGPGSASAVEPTTIVIERDGFYMRNRRLTEAELTRNIEKTSGYGTDKTIVIKCTSTSTHKDLMKVLDICAKFNMKNIAIFTM